MSDIFMWPTSSIFRSDSLKQINATAKGAVGFPLGISFGEPVATMTRTPEILQLSSFWSVFERKWVPVRRPRKRVKRASVPIQSERKRL
jgi:hypothetical protein